MAAKRVDPAGRDRADRLSEVLRSNIARRKAQARARLQAPACVPDQAETDAADPSRSSQD